ncbi:MAG: hypothetical protein MJ252_02110 [archaeon]|nr:hypothetical protein [archaeon]
MEKQSELKKQKKRKNAQEIEKQKFNLIQKFKEEEDSNNFEEEFIPKNKTKNKENLKPNTFCYGNKNRIEYNNSRKNKENLRPNTLDKIIEVDSSQRRKYFENNEDKKESEKEDSFKTNPLERAASDLNVKDPIKQYYDLEDMNKSNKEDIFINNQNNSEEEEENNTIKNNKIEKEEKEYYFNKDNSKDISINKSDNDTEIKRINTQENQNNFKNKDINIEDYKYGEEDENIYLNEEDEQNEEEEKENI